MSKSVEKSGRTVDEAIHAALDELQIDLEDAEVDIMDEGTKGVWGIFGGKEARVKVRENKPDSKKVREFISRIVEEIGLETSINIINEEEAMQVNITGDDVGILIGRHGETLQAINYICNLVVNKEKEDYRRIVIDVENYRSKREDKLKEIGKRAASRVVKYKKPLSLEPMSAYERRVIHTELQDHQYVETISQGDEPYRFVVIKLKEGVDLRHADRNRSNYKKRY